MRNTYNMFYSQCRNKSDNQVQQFQEWLWYSEAQKKEAWATSQSFFFKHFIIFEGDTGALS